MRFETKYGQPFERFRPQILTSLPDFTTEQDYFDWGMAITAADDMKAKLDEFLNEIEVVLAKMNLP